MDASSKWLGAVIPQKEEQENSFRALSRTQERYVQIDKETLAIVYRTKKFHQYVYGKSVTAQCDYRPLEFILNKPLHQAPPRL